MPTAYMNEDRKWLVVDFDMVNGKVETRFSYTSDINKAWTGMPWALPPDLATKLKKVQVAVVATRHVVVDEVSEARFRKTHNRFLGGVYHDR